MKSLEEIIADIEAQHATEKLREHPLATWRRVIRRRCEWQNILRGSWRCASAQEMVTDFRLHVEPETFGPPAPLKKPLDDRV